MANLILTGTTRLVLYPNDNQAFGEVEFVGEFGANDRTQRTSDVELSVAFNIPSEQTPYDKRIWTECITSDRRCATRLTATDIHTNLPRLRGIIAERIAWGRVANTRSQADAIASAHTADDIRQDLDRKVNESVAAIQMTICKRNSRSYVTMAKISQY